MPSLGNADRDFVQMFDTCLQAYAECSRHVAICILVDAYLCAEVQLRSKVYLHCRLYHRQLLMTESVLTDLLTERVCGQVYDHVGAGVGAAR